MSRRLSQLSFRARVLLVTAGVFVALVAFKIHGSSIALSAKVWAPNEAMQHFIASPLLSAMSPEASERWRGALMAKPRGVLMDQWGRDTLWALAQFTHVPAFPVVNTNIGLGQNMLTQPWIPVAHVSTIARPMTWGYLLLGPERGLAWSWWSQVFGCFAAVYLLFELIVPKRPWLAVLGAIWFCASAYVACWSLWPAYTTGLGISAMVSVYWLCRSSRPAVIVASGAIAGVSLAGFVMQLYPPWQVPLGHAFLVIFGALLWRDQLWKRWREHGVVRWCSLVLTVLVAVAVVGSFLLSSVEALEALANSEYPGKRRLVGGDCPPWRLFGGFYNAFTHEIFTAETNASEASGFFLFFPAVAIAAVASPGIRSRLGPVVWSSLALLAFLTYYCVAPVPGWLASATLFSYVQGYRCQIAVGLLSIVVSIKLLAVAAELPQGWRSLRTACAVFVICAALFLWQGVELESNLHLFDGGSSPPWVWGVSLAAAALAALMAAGWARCFAGLLLIGLGLTSASFNPLSIGFPDWRASELGTLIGRIAEGERRAGEGRSLWLTYGGGPFPYNGVVVHAMGMRAITGAYGHPQPEFWKPLDAEGTEHFKYNRVAMIRLMPSPLPSRLVKFKLLDFHAVEVFASPLHPALRQMGARYVLTLGKPRGITLTDPPFEMMHHSIENNFAVWRLPHAAP